MTAAYVSQLAPHVVCMRVAPCPATSKRGTGLSLEMSVCVPPLMVRTYLVLAAWPSQCDVLKEAPQELTLLILTVQPSIVTLLTQQKLTQVVMYL